MFDVVLRSTGQAVRLVDEAQPAALRKRERGFTQIIIPPVKHGARPSIQRVANKKLRFGLTPVKRLLRNGSIKFTK